MSGKTDYVCKSCGKTAALSPDDTVPDCCDGPMETAGPLPVCQTSETAEHSRMEDDGGPCDDGRAG